MSEPTGDAGTGAATGPTAETAPAELPADHPLVKTLATQKAEIRELKAKARKLDEIEEASKSDAEKAADRIAKLETEAATVPAKVAEIFKSHLVTYHAIPDEDSILISGDTPELVLKQTERYLAHSSNRRKHVVPREGENHNAEATSDLRQFTQQLFNRG